MDDTICIRNAYLAYLINNRTACSVIGVKDFTRKFFKEDQGLSREIVHLYKCSFNVHR